eukprot:TRINITY_DN1343_c0_g1_i1.p2 TRINITY_DN1343_c0_g1~~TRINITY_DN1343_c0_g1_i1.p2  ORF type:complete len:318 (+),score=77.59 TRINITY_DN1343_c0_g1_i1:1182-2135(+)
MAAQSDLREWLEELRWREQEAAASGARRPPADLGKALTSYPHLGEAAQGGAADLMDSVARVRMRRAEAVYLRVARHHRCAPPAPPSAGDGEPPASPSATGFLSGAFYRALGRLRGVDPDWGGGSVGGLGSDEVAELRRALQSERMLRPKAELLRAASSCPLARERRIGDRELLLELQAWARATERRLQEAEDHALLERKQVLTQALAIAERALGSPRQKQTGAALAARMREGGDYDSPRTPCRTGARSGSPPRLLRGAPAASPASGPPAASGQLNMLAGMDSERRRPRQRARPKSALPMPPILGAYTDWLGESAASA